jgi:hypothetical protein
MPFITITVNRPTLRPETVRRRRALLAVAGLAASYVALGGIAGADAPPSGFVSLSVPFKLATNTSIAANKTLVKVVTGGSTTVPTDANTVQLHVTVAKGTAAGTLAIFPTDDPAQTVQVLSWAAGQTVAADALVGVGLKNGVTFVNQSPKAVTVTAPITAYASQYPPATINGVAAGGSLTGTYPSPQIAPGAVSLAQDAGTDSPNATLPAATVAGSNCVARNVLIPGVRHGDQVVMVFTTGTPNIGMIVYALGVFIDGQVLVNECNITGSLISTPALPVHITTWR